MSQIRFYIDEDSMNQALVRALRARNIDVVTVNETDTAGQLDEEQLMMATEQGRVLYSHNIADFCQLHVEFLEAEKDHSGIALLAQDYSVGEQLKALSGQGYFILKRAFNVLRVAPANRCALAIFL